MADKYISKSYLVSNLKNFKTAILDPAYAVLSTTYTKTEVDNLIGAIPKFSIQPVDSLPTTDISNATVYLLKTSETETQNLYTEYIYVNNAWEQLGTQSVNLSGYYTSSEVDTKLEDKVDKVSGKGLSANDYTTDEKNKLAGIADNAEVNVQADWSVTDVTSDAYILNKPEKLPASDVTDTYAADGKVPVSGTAVASAISNKADKATTLSGYGITDAATSAQGTKADSAIQTIKINGEEQTKTDGVVNLPAYPTTLPASDTTSTYDSTGTAPVSGAAVASAISGLKADGATGIGAGNTISSWEESNGVVSITTQAISITKSQVSDFPENLPASNTTSTYSATGTDPVNGIAVASAISGKADTTDVPEAETSNIDFTTEWDTTNNAEG